MSRTHGIEVACKRGGQTTTVKNGFVRDKQRFRCKACGCNFVLGDGRVDPHASAKRALATMLYSIGKGSFHFIARLFGVTPAAILKWVRREAADLEYPCVTGNIRELEFDEMWHFLLSKKQTVDHQSLGPCFPSNYRVSGRPS